MFSFRKGKRALSPALHSRGKTPQLKPTAPSESATQLKPTASSESATSVLSRPPQLQPTASFQSATSSNTSFGSYVEVNFISDRQASESTEITCISEADLKCKRDQLEQQVMSTLQVKASTARLLLSRVRPPWDIDKVVESWFDDGMCARLLAKQCRAGDDASSLCIVHGECEECEVIFSLSCGHTVCTECLATFLQSKLHPSDGPPVSPPYTCQQLGSCGCEGVLEVEGSELPLDDADVQLLMSHDADAAENDSTPYRKCPTPGCNRHNRPVVGHINLRCECGAHYCKACGMEAHFPVPCQLTYQWREYAQQLQAALRAETEAHRREREMLEMLHGLGRRGRGPGMRLGIDADDEMDEEDVDVEIHRRGELMLHRHPLHQGVHQGGGAWRRERLYGLENRNGAWQRLLGRTEEALPNAQLRALSVDDLLQALPPRLRTIMEQLGLREAVAE